MSEERLIQPGDLTEGEELPPRFSPANLPEGPPIEAVLQNKTRFYGPVTGPFSIQVPNDILQYGDDWEGFIAVDPNGFVSAIEESVFSSTYEIVGEAAPSRPLEFVPDLAQLQEVDAALRHTALQIQYKAAFDEAVRALVAAGLMPDLSKVDAEETLLQPEPDEGPDAAEASEAIGVEQADRYDEDAEREAGEAALEQDEADDKVPVDDLSTHDLIAVLRNDQEQVPDAGRYEVPAVLAAIRGRAEHGNDETAQAFVSALDAATTAAAAEADPS